MTNLRTTIFLLTALPFIFGCDELKDKSSDESEKECKATPALALVPSPPPEEPVIPYQQWTKLPAETVGLLFNAGNPDWVSYPTGNQTEVYHYSADGSSPYALYFPSSGEGYNYIAGWSVDTASGPKAYDAAMFQPTTTNTYGLSDDAHIVRLQVNDGVGGGGGIHFVATEVTVLDGTAGYPATPAAAITDARSRFDAFLDSAAATRDAKISAAITNVVAQNPNAASTVDMYTQTVNVKMHASWHDDEKKLRVTFVEHGTYSHAKDGDTYVPYCPPDAPCAEVEPIQRVNTFEIQLAYRYVYDGMGSLLSEEEEIVAPKVDVTPGTTQDTGLPNDQDGVDESMHGVDEMEESDSNESGCN